MFGFLYIIVNDKYLYEFLVGEGGEDNMHKIDLTKYPYRRSYIEKQGVKIYHA